MHSFKIGEFEINKDGTFIISELSGNHANNLQIILDSILESKKAGANAIKIQTFTADSMTLNIDNEEFMCNPNGLWKNRRLYDVYEEASIPYDWYDQIFSYAKEVGILIFSSPFDKEAVDLLEKYNVPAYKIASFEITDYELIKYTASKMKPILISTGIATIDEIQGMIVDMYR